jgi:leucyl-tRNA synthetase
MEHGNGAIMAVPAHDERDWDFAKAFTLPIIRVVSADKPTPETDYSAEPAECTIADGYAVNSGEFTGLTTQDAIWKHYLFEYSPY